MMRERFTRFSIRLVGCALLGGMLVMVVPSVTHAHPLDVTFTRLEEQNGGLRIETRMTARQVGIAFLKTDNITQPRDLVPLKDIISRVVMMNLRVSSGDHPCEIRSSVVRFSEDDGTTLALEGVTFRGDAVCDGETLPAELTIENTLFTAEFPAQRNIMAFDDTGSNEVVFTPRETRGVLNLDTNSFHFAGTNAHDTFPSGALGNALRFIFLGIEHIGIGYDHIAFIIGVHLVVRRIRDILKIVTSFTIAHSITLTLSALDILRIPNGAAEAAIAATIVYIGVENLFRKEFRRRSRITFFLGLVHGLGFASVLREIGIPRQFFLLNILSFNVGIEAGQLMLITALVPFLFLLPHFPRLNRAVIYWGSATISAFGIFWFVQRIW